MKETGLMFKAPPVRAILSGQKTQTRRVVKWRDLATGLNLGFSGLAVFSNTPNTFTLESQSRNGWESRSSPTSCPAGHPGDRIYVRETWNWFDPQVIPANRAGPRAPFTGKQGGREIEWVTAYAADGPLPYPGYNGREHWRPSIHMPKWAARIWLEITGVRVERLQAISEEDAKAEGVDAAKYQGLDRAYARAFSELWESTGGDWAANPWVWVIDFKRIEQPAPKKAP